MFSLSLKHVSVNLLLRFRKCTYNGNAWVENTRVEKATHVNNCYSQLKNISLASISLRSSTTKVAPPSIEKLTIFDETALLLTRSATRERHFRSAITLVIISDSPNICYDIISIDMFLIRHVKAKVLINFEIRKIHKMKSIYRIRN